MEARTVIFRLRLALKSHTRPELNKVCFSHRSGEAAVLTLVEVEISGMNNLYYNSTLKSYWIGAYLGWNLVGFVGEAAGVELPPGAFSVTCSLFSRLSTISAFSNSLSTFPC